MSDGTKSSNGDSKKIEVVEVDDKELDVDLELGATMFNVDDVKQKLNTKDKGKVLDGESLLESLADNSQIIHVKGGKTIDDKSTKKVARTKKDGVSANRKDRDDKEAR